MPRITKVAFEKHGFATAELITEWPRIVGADLAAYTRPDRLRWPRALSGDAEAGAGRPSATLVLAVDPARALDVQYKARQIAERINVYLGYRAVADVRIEQRQVAAASLPAVAPRRPAQSSPRPLPASVTSISDESLKAALTRLSAGLQREKAGT